MDCERFIIKTSTGTYKQVVPVNCDLYPAFLDLIGLSQSEIKPLFKIDFTRLQTLGIKKSVKFASNDELRPNMQCFEFTILPDKVKIVATNGFMILKYNIELNTDIFGQKTFLIPAKSFVGHKGLLSISFFEDCYIINRQKFNYPENDLRYPDYNSLWPAYNKGITFYKNDLVEALKSVKPMLNKYNPVVKFNFDDNKLKIVAENLDYNNETDLRLNLIRNDLQPFTIGFNCNYFLDCLDIIQSDKITLETNGAADKMVLINNDIVLMPVKIENYG
jgi:DNA polymerase III sliding clamp (beta) subunit (PCNA family)